MKREIPRKSLFFFEKYFSSIDVHQAENKTEILSQLHLLLLKIISQSKFQRK